MSRRRSHRRWAGLWMAFAVAFAVMGVVALWQGRLVEAVLFVGFAGFNVLAAVIEIERADR